MKLKIVIEILDNEAPEGTSFEEREKAMRDFITTDAFDGLNMTIEKLDITQL